jgi:ABC-type sugar transport system permease subunit
MNVPSPLEAQMNQQLTTEGRLVSRRASRRTDLFPFWLLIPSLVLIGAVLFYPMLEGIIYSFRSGSVAKLGDFVWLENYRRLLASRDFWHALQFSAVFAVFNVIGCYVVGLGLALLLNTNVPARGFFRMALLLPWVIPSVVSMMAWRWMISDETGLVNIMLGWVGIKPIYFLVSEQWAITMVIIIKIWRSFPFMMLSLLAALQTIDHHLYEAAQIDGATPWQSFRFITMPHLWGISSVMWILMTIWTVNDFDTPWLLSQGGPSNATENLILLAYRTTFSQNDVGLSSAIAVVSLILLMILANLLMRRQNAEAA